MTAQRVVLIALCSLTTSLVPSAKAGPLDPPTGPVSATQKTIIYSLPYSISAPGTYVLGGAIAPAPGGTPLITISAGNVVLDLAGFSLGANARTPVEIVGFGLQRITIRNGQLRGAFTTGTVPLRSTQAVQSLTLEDVLLESNLGFYAVDIPDSSNLCVMRNCRAFNPVRLGSFSQVDSCTILPSQGPALEVGQNSNVRNSTLSTTSSAALRVGDNSVIEACSLFKGSGTTGNSVLETGTNCLVRICSIQSNTSTPAVILGSRSLIDTCTISSGSDGIRAASNCCVRSCNLVSSTQTAIVATGNNNRIEGNTISCSAVGVGGISTSGVTGNLVVRNNVILNGSPGPAYSGTAGNSYGPIANVTASGEFTAVPNANHPWANFQN